MSGSTSRPILHPLDIAIPATLPTMRVGPFEVTALLDGYFALDGGAMHGNIPRVIWEIPHPPDDVNRIRLALRSLLVRGPGLVAVVETGLGAHHDARFADRFGVIQPPTLLERLAGNGIQPEDVDLVVNTHLHWDHAGGNVRPGKAGDLVPTFPRAEYVVQRQEWDDANHTHERSRGSYRAEDFRPIEASGQLRLLDGPTTLTEGLSVEPVGGHTRGMQIVHVDGDGQHLVFLADLVPTRTHLDYPWVMGYDLYPVDSLMAKKRLLPRAIEEDWLIAFVHEPTVPFGRVRLDARGRPTLAPLDAAEAGDSSAVPQGR